MTTVKALERADGQVVGSLAGLPFSYLAPVSIQRPNDNVVYTAADFWGSGYLHLPNVGVAGQSVRLATSFKVTTTKVTFSSPTLWIFTEQPTTVIVDNAPVDLTDHDTDHLAVTSGILGNIVTRTLQPGTFVSIGSGTTADITLEGTDLWFALVLAGTYTPDALEMLTLFPRILQSS